jgi:hypothetical protein
MKNSKILFLFAFSFVLVMGSKVLGEDDVEGVKQYVICKNQKTVRTIRVECPKNGECNTIYNKEGTDLVEGSNNNISGSQRILGNIKANLEKAAWKCNDVTSNAKIDH